MDFLASVSLATIFILLVRSFLIHLCFCENLACIQTGLRLRLELEWWRGRKIVDCMERTDEELDEEACMERMLRYSKDGKAYPYVPFNVNTGMVDIDYPWWHCTRAKNHKGDHVCANDNPYRPILARWRRGFTLRPFQQR